MRFAIADDADWCRQADPSLMPGALREKIARKEILVAEFGKKLIGYLRFEYLDAAVPMINLVHVRKPYRRQGVARGMLTFLETYLREEHRAALLCAPRTNDVETHGWCRSVGFRECGVVAGLGRDGVGLLIFGKSLKKSDA